jgi:hypothetical protein
VVDIEQKNGRKTAPQMSYGLSPVKSNPSTRTLKLLTRCQSAAPVTGVNHRTNLKHPWLRRLISSGDQPPTGEPNAGNRPVRFGGRGDLNSRPYPIPKRTLCRSSLKI